MDSDQLAGISLSGIINQFSLHLPEPGPELQPGLAQCGPVHQPGLPVMEPQYGGGYTISPPVKPYIRILEQPKANSLRFRYQCEGRGAGALQGKHSSPDCKTFPKIQIVGSTRPAVVVVSCVTHDGEPPRTHPHNLVSPASVGKDGCKRGVCTLNINNEDMTVEFQHLGIQCVRRKDIEESLRTRQEIRVDPFKQGFKHMENPSSIDLNAVKLCFQAFLEDPNKSKKPGRFTEILDPVCSSPIFDAKAKKELQIMEMSDSQAPAQGGKKLLLFCEKVTREDIKVRFSDSAGWEGWADFSPADVHKQYGISFRCPRYRDGHCKQKTKVFVQLFKPSDESVSEPQDFYFLPAGEEGAVDQRPGNGSRGGQAPVKQQIGYKPGAGAELRVKQEDWGKAGGVKQENWGGLGWGEQYSPAPASAYHTAAPPPYIPNIPVVEAGPPYHALQHYGAQPSPDSQSFANLNLASPQHKREERCGLEQEVENLSGKIENFSLSDAIDASLSMAAPYEEPRPGRGKRSQAVAALESGSAVVPREMARLQVLQSCTLHCYL